MLLVLKRTVSQRGYFWYQHAMLEINVNFTSECFIPIFILHSNKLVVSRITDLAIAIH